MCGHIGELNEKSVMTSEDVIKTIVANNKEQDCDCDEEYTGGMVR